MTEFRRAGTAVEALERLVAGLTSAPADGGHEVATRYAEAEKLLAELGLVAEKMRRKCAARAELELVEAELRSKLPGAPEQALKAVQELLSADAAAPEGAEAIEAAGGLASIEALRPLAEKAAELEGVATYGAKMVEKVLELLARFDAARAAFAAEVAPRLGAAAAAGQAEAAALRAAAAEAAAAAAAEAQRRSEEELRRPVQALLADDQRKAAEREAAAAAVARRLEEEAARRLLVEAAVGAEADELARARAQEERRLVELGPDGACKEALTSMLSLAAGAYREALEALQGMLARIASEPGDPRWRLIRLANEGFQQVLGRRPGAWLFLRGVGFVLKAREELTRSKGFAGVLSAADASGPAADKFLVLEEPDMMGDFEAWTAWHVRIKHIALFLEGLGRHIVTRTAHLGRHGLDLPMIGVVSPGEVLHGWNQVATSE